MVAYFTVTTFKRVLNNIYVLVVLSFLNCSYYVLVEYLVFELKDGFVEYILVLYLFDWLFSGFGRVIFNFLFFPDCRIPYQLV